MGFLVLLLSSASSIQALARPVRVVPDLPGLVSSSDAVFKGEVLDNTTLGTLEYALASGENAAVLLMSARVRVDRTLKGPEPTGGEVKIEWYLCDMPVGWEAVLPGDYGILFASMTPQGYVPTDFGEPLLPVSRLGSPPQVLQSDTLAAVEEELVNSLRDPDFRLVCLAGMCLRALDYGPTTAAALRELAATHPDARCRGRAVEALLARGQSDGQHLAMDLLTSHLSLDAVTALDSAAAGLSSSRFRGADCAGHIRCRLLDLTGATIHRPEDTPLAMQLLEFPDSYARDNGLQALRRIGFRAGSFESVARVIELLEDPELGWLASLTLDEITDHRNAAWSSPSREGFRENRDFYIKQWKDWWENKGKAIFPPPSP